MTDSNYDSKLKTIIGATYGVVGAGAITLLVGLVVIPAPRLASAMPSYTQQTGLSCGQCHANPAGGGALTSFGKSFAANGHQVPGGAAPVTTAVQTGKDTFMLTWPKVCYGWCPREYD